MSTTTKRRQDASAFPAALRPIIEQGFLDREFEHSMQNRPGYRMVAERKEFSAGIGETITMARDGLSARGNGVTETYTLSLDHYVATTDLNMVTNRIGIASQFLLNAAINGEQAARSLDELARFALFRAYLKPATTRKLDSSLTMGALVDAVSDLRALSIPTLDGVYNCYLDPISARQLFADHGFRQLFQGATSANQVFRKGMINDTLGLRFIPVSEHLVEPHPTLAGAVLRRAVVCGAGVLVEGQFAGMDAEDVAPKDAITSIIDGVCMVTREPIDRLGQIIAQAWYWIGGFGAVAEIVDGEREYRRALVLEHVG